VSLRFLFCAHGQAIYPVPPLLPTRVQLRRCASFRFPGIPEIHVWPRSCQCVIDAARRAAIRFESGDILHRTKIVSKRKARRSANDGKTIPASSFPCRAG